MPFFFLFYLSDWQNSLTFPSGCTFLRLPLTTNCV